MNKKIIKQENLCYFYIFNFNWINFVLFFLFYFCIIFITSHHRYLKKIKNTPSPLERFKKYFKK